MNDEIEKPPLWERQAYDTDKSYAYFHDYYLRVDAKDRSLAHAYRQYRKVKGITTPFSGVVPGTWSNWFNGTNSKGKKPAGTIYETAPSWAMRARAYDDAQNAKEREIWEQRRRAIREEEWAIGDRLLDRARRMLTATLFERINDGANGLVIHKPSNWSEADITRTFEMALKVQRRAADMDQGRLLIEHDWKAQLEKAGINAEDIFNKLVNELAVGMARDSDAGSSEFDDSGGDE